MSGIPHRNRDADYSQGYNARNAQSTQIGAPARRYSNATTLRAALQHFHFVSQFVEGDSPK
jgi:hypothetical protein